MTDDRESDDAADWLSAQFGSHEPDEPKATEPDVAEADKDVSGAETMESGTTSGARDADAAPNRMPAAPAVPTPPAPAAPVPPASGGFSWGLTPRGANKEPDAQRSTTPEPTAPEPASAEPTTSEPVTPTSAPSEPAITERLDASPAEPARPAAPTPPTEPAHPAEPTPPASTAPPFSPPRLVPPSPPVSSPVVPPAVPLTPPATPPVQPAVPNAVPEATEPPPVSPAALAHSDSRFAPPPLVSPPLTPPPGAPAADVSVLPVAGVPEPPEPFDASLGGAPSVEAEPPTMALPWESAGTELFTPVAASGAVAEPATELLSGFETTPADVAAGSSIDSLFGENQFRDYEAEPATSLSPLARSASTAPAAAAAKAERLPVPRSQKVLLWIAGVLAALLVLIALFYLGTKIPQTAAAPAPSPTATKSPTPSPTPTVAAVGPLAPGTYKWDRLLGGECLTPFDTPWAEKFTVVDCATPHAAQMVARGVFSEPTAAATDPSAPATPAVGQSTVSSYPGVAALQAQINLLCSAPTVINFGAAGAYTDIQFTASYPATDKQWTDGDHNYYCFVTRSSGQPLTSSVAVPPAAPAQ